MKSRYRNLVASSLAVAMGVVLAAAGGLGFSSSLTPGLVRHLEGRHGSGVRARLEGWVAFIRTAPGYRPATPVRPTLEAVNNFFNRIPSEYDINLWGVEEYWATPAETLAVNGADCEDYALSKYFSLKELGVAVGSLRLVYARVEGQTAAHMVLAYFPDPRAEPLIMDNLDGRVLAGTARPELTPVYMFNDEDLLYFQQGASTVRMDPFQHRKWKEYLEKLAREQKF